MFCLKKKEKNRHPWLSFVLGVTLKATISVLVGNIDINLGDFLSDK